MDQRRVVPLGARGLAVQSDQNEIVLRSRVVNSKDTPAVRLGTYVNGTEIANLGIEIDMSSGTLIAYLKAPSNTYTNDKPEVLFTHKLWEGT